MIKKISHYHHIEPLPILPRVQGLNGVTEMMTPVGKHPSPGTGIERNLTNSILRWLTSFPGGVGKTERFVQSAMENDQTKIGLVPPVVPRERGVSNAYTPFSPLQG